jgi:polyhydroxyalkanoate synthesis repressor PhaR
MVKDGIVFVVLDAKGADITRAVLTQIIVEEEGKGDNLLPINFLRQLISFYGDNMQRMLLPHYLEHSIDAFARNQESIHQYMQETFGSMFPFGGLEEMGKQNIAMFESAMKMFTPFPNGGAAEGDAAAGPAEEGSAAKGPAAAAPAEQSGTGVEELKRQLGEIQRQIDEMTAKPK